MGAGKRVEEENRVRAVRIELAPGFVGERDARQHARHRAAAPDRSGLPVLKNRVRVSAGMGGD